MLEKLVNIITCAQPRSMKPFGTFFVNLDILKQYNIHTTDNLMFPETERRALLLCCDYFSYMGADNFPSFVLRECATILSPAVQQRFHSFNVICTRPS